MIGRLCRIGGLVVAVSAWPSSVFAQPASPDDGLSSSGSKGPVEREAGLDPGLLEIVDQIVGLRMSEEGLLSDLSEDQRSRVLEAVARLLAPAETTVVAESDVESAPTETPTVAIVEPEASASDEFEPPSRISEPSTESSSVADVPSERAAGESVACPGWLVWDTNEDRMLSGADRYWRHFVVWVDDGDGVAEADEMRDTFELGLRKLDLDLRSYDGAKDSTGVVERRQIGGLERLRVELLRGDAEYGVLAIDLGGMVRGEAPALRLRSADGDSTRDLSEGYVPVQEGLEVEEVFGSQTRWRPLLCDR